MKRALISSEGLATSSMLHIISTSCKYSYLTYLSYVTICLLPLLFFLDINISKEFYWERGVREKSSPFFLPAISCSVYLNLLISPLTIAFLLLCAILPLSPFCCLTQDSFPDCISVNVPSWLNINLWAGCVVFLWNVKYTNLQLLSEPQRSVIKALFQVAEFLHLLLALIYLFSFIYVNKSCVYTFVSFKLAVVLLFWEGRTEGRKKEASLPLRTGAVLAWGQLYFWKPGFISEKQSI